MICKIIYPRKDIHSRGLWLMAERTLGGPVKMVAAYGGSGVDDGRYYFRLKEQSDDR